MTVSYTHLKALLTEYNGKEEKTFEDILDFHVKFERIHPFQDLSLIHILWNSEYALEFNEFYENYKEQYKIIKHQRDIARKDQMCIRDRCAGV